MPSQDGCALKRIEVQSLFGHYDYDVHVGASGTSGTMLILYGDNGSGKTTILRLLYHLLGSETSQGHKSFVAKTRFKSVTFEFDNGLRVQARRTAGALSGSFTMEVAPPGSLAPNAFDVPVDSGNDVPSSPALDEFIKTNRPYMPTLLMLSDDRQFNVSNAGPSSLRALKQRYRPRTGESVLNMSLSPEPSDPEHFAIGQLEDTLRGAADWIRRQVLQGATRGESDVNRVFRQIIQRVATEQTRGRPPRGQTRSEIVDRVNSIVERHKAFASLGFVPQFKADALLEAIHTVSPGRYRTLNSILSPYLDSLEAKLNALTGIHERVRVLVDSLNGFLHDKHVRFSVGQGIVVRTSDRETLQPGQLSSGERHLLLLLTNTLMAHDAGCSLFIIDEPEISLNVKWQRKLVSALLACASRSSIQYVLATHSIELLAQHRANVVGLVPVPSTK